MEKLVYYNQLLLVMYQLVMSVCAIVSMYTFARSGTPGRYFRLLLLAGFLIELLALYEQRTTERNALSYCWGAIATYALIALYYWHLPPLQGRSQWLWLWLVLGLGMGFYCWYSAADATVATVQYIWFLGLSTVLLSLICLYAAIVKSRVHWSRYISAWIALLLLLYWSIILLSYGMLHIAAGYAPGILPAITCSMLLLNITFYGCAIFIVYKRSNFNADI
jgi:hypothetical protein